MGIFEKVFEKDDAGRFFKGTADNGLILLRTADNGLTLLGLAVMISEKLEVNFSFSVADRTRFCIAFDDLKASSLICSPAADFGLVYTPGNADVPTR